MKKRDWDLLRSIRLMSDSTGGMHQGVQADTVAPGPAKRLSDAGYITLFFPHNPVHKERWQITVKGRAALKQAADEK